MLCMKILLIIWLLLYWYYTDKLVMLKREYAKKIIGLIMLIILTVAPSFFIPIPLCCFIAVGYCLLYDIFYDERSIKEQFFWIIAPGAVMLSLSFFPDKYFYIYNAVVVFACLVLLSVKKKYFSWRNTCLIAVVYIIISLLVLCVSDDIFLMYTGWRTDSIFDDTFLMHVGWTAVIIELLIFFILEGSLQSYKLNYESKTEKMQNEMLNHQYEEIRNIYLNMRGWRHDYHNHLQVLKVQLRNGEYKEAGIYLDELEQNLDNVDTYVKSGNMMLDAILNSKLSIAEQHEIRVNCTASMPPSIPVDDVELCVIVGNLLDNAIEACEKIPVADRFIRIYVVVNKEQLYMSVQNSAKEELDFNERNYISTKRGNHGLGMKRVKVLIDKYDGYLNLANEAGIFAAEVTMPLTIRDK